MSQASGEDTGERRGPGRPAESSPETLRRWAEWRLLQDHGVSAAKIAERAGVSPQAVSNALAKMRAGMADADSPPGSAQESPPRPKPRRLSEGKLAHRAVLALRRDIRFPAMPAVRKLLWLECVMEIHALGDDDGLSFGEDGDPFETHEEFASALGGTGADLEALLRRGLLARLPNGGIDLPSKIGLKPREPARRAPMFAGMGARNAPGSGQGGAGQGSGGVVRTARPSDDAVGSASGGAMFQVLPGGLSEAMRPSTEIPISVDKPSTEIPISVDSTLNENPASVERGGLARAAYSTVSSTESEESKEGSTSHTHSNSLSRATAESTETPISVEAETPVSVEATRQRESSDFDEFWQRYPRKDDKGHARRAWITALRKASPATIIAGLDAYPFNSDPQFHPMPATWLNGERWLPVEAAVKWTPDQWFDQVLGTGPYAPGADDPIIDGTLS